MLPAVDIDGRFVTESDDILLALETTFGTLLQSMRDPEVRGLRKLERQLFSAWFRSLAQTMDPAPTFAHCTRARTDSLPC